MDTAMQGMTALVVSAPFIIGYGIWVAALTVALVIALVYAPRAWAVLLMMYVMGVFLPVTIPGLALIKGIDALISAAQGKAKPQPTDHDGYG